MKRLIFLLLALLFSVSLAATPIGPATSPPCKSLSSTPTPSGTPAAGAGRVTLDTFVPDPGCWVRDFSWQVNSIGLVGYACTLAEVMIAAGVLIGGLKWLSSGSITPFLKALAIGMVTFSLVLSYSQKQGGAFMVAQWITDSWTTTYIASSGVGQTWLNGTVLRDAANLDQQISNYVRISSSLSQIRSDLVGASKNTDPAALNRIYTDMVEQASSDSAAYGDKFQIPLSSYSWVYFLMLGLFSVYSAIILSSGMLIILMVIVLPLLLALTTLGHLTPLKAGGIIWLSNLAMVLVLPVFLALLSGVILKTPVQSLAQALNDNVATGQQMIAQTQQAMSQCGSALYDPVCNIKETVMANVDSYVTSLGDIVVGMGRMAFVLVVCFGIGLTQVRRIPAVIAQLLGTIAGGESSGVRSTPPGLPRINLPRIAGGGSGSAGKVTKPAPAPSGGDPGNRQVSVQRVPRSPLGSGSGTPISPQMVLAKTITVGAQKALPSSDTKNRS